MPPHSNRGDTEEKTSGERLDKARTDATRLRGYNSARTRIKISDAYKARSGGHIPYDWQLDVAEAILLGLDTTVIAGTGAGKTVPFILPLFADDRGRKMVIIISPLKELQQDQVTRFEKMGLPAVAINGDTWSSQLAKDVRARRYRVLLLGPEMCLHHRPCLTLLRDPTVSADICPLVVDEAHCIYQWGTSFRTAWSEIGRLRSILPPGIPFLACSATMTPIVLADVRHRLEISVDRSYHLNLGNCRSNITPVIVRMSGAATNLSSLNFLVRDVRKGKPLPRLLIFFNTRELTQRATEHIRALIPEELRPQIDYMHGMRTKKGKECVMREFRERKINVLCSTDCAGMGTDISDVDIVAQFMIPQNLSVSDQHQGRAGRAGQAARYFLLVEASVFQKINPKKRRHNDETLHTEDTDEDSSESEDEESADTKPSDVKYRKKVDDSLRKYIETTTCRRDIADKYFGNPPRPQITVPCCDNCIRATEDIKLISLDDILDHLDAVSPLSTHIYGYSTVELPLSRFAALSLNDPALDLPSPLSTLPLSTLQKPKRKGQQREQHRTDCRLAAEGWRLKIYSQFHAASPLGPEAVLPDRLLTIFVADQNIKSVQEIREHPQLSRWSFIEQLGGSILERLQQVDELYQQAEKDEKERKAERKRQDRENTRERKRVKKEQDEEDARQRAQERVASLWNEYERHGEALRASRDIVSLRSAAHIHQQPTPHAAPAAGPSALFSVYHLPPYNYPPPPQFHPYPPHLPISQGEFLINNQAVHHQHYNHEQTVSSPEQIARHSNLPAMYWTPHAQPLSHRPVDSTLLHHHHNSTPQYVQYQYGSPYTPTQVHQARTHTNSAQNTPYSWIG